MLILWFSRVKVINKQMNCMPTRMLKIHSFDCVSSREENVPLICALLLFCRKRTRSAFLTVSVLMNKFHFAAQINYHNAYRVIDWWCSLRRRSKKSLFHVVWDQSCEDGSASHNCLCKTCNQIKSGLLIESPHTRVAQPCGIWSRASPKRGFSQKVAPHPAQKHVHGTIQEPR